jgi:outer membrane protein TolC
VLTATVTIICSFLPLLILTGSVGEFIMALPITVAIALTVSFIVAVMLTPLLCRTFIKKGLHDHDAPKAGTPGKEKKSLLDRLQEKYGILIRIFMKRKWVALTLGVCAFAFGVMLFVFVPQQFFPSAERNQFVIDVWMPQGTRIEATDAIMGRIEKELASRKGIAHYATFVGQSAPRFYYNVNPQQPDGAYGQFIVNTASVKDTDRIVKELRPALAAVAPEAMVIVKELQQGAQMEAPIEVRITGDDVEELKGLGNKVQAILENVPSSQYVNRDYFNDSYRLDVKVNDELANRLGITDAAVSQTLSGGFEGVAVSTFWEGDRAVTIKLRLDPAYRSQFADIGNTYINSDLTHARVPLRAIATLSPESQTSRLVRRNGVRTLTVRAFVKPGYYASKLLEQAMPKIKALELPTGYRIYYGGEKDNQDETFPQMMIALAISLVAIFLVLLVQFRTISEPLVVMASIPLTLFGAVLGLIITRNPFGFTAFMGMISLCGIVVRNGIILVDYCNERLAEGESLEQAARDAGARRLRPIFLTTMAAAVGVTPMILSRSSLWSPLASVIAFGLIFSMFFTLLVIPVLYVIVKSRTAKPNARIVTIIACCIFLGAGQVSAEPLKLSLPEAVDLALKQNTLLKISRARVLEKEEHMVSTKANYFPRLSNETSYVHLTNRQIVDIHAGSLGTIPGLGPFPSQDTPVNQGRDTALVTTTKLTQPLSQLFKIDEANEIAKADHKISESDNRKDELETILAVHQLYYGLLIAQKQRDAEQAALDAAQEGLRESEDAVRSGNVLDVVETGSRVQLLQGRQLLLTAENQISDTTSELNKLLGLPLETVLDLAEVDDSSPATQTLQQYVQEALFSNPELQVAKDTVEKANHAVSAANDEYIPDVSLFASHTYQNGAPFLDHNIGIVGVQLTWNIFDWGYRRGVVGERRAQLIQAKENVKWLDQSINVEISKAYRKLERTKLIMEVASEAVALQKENERLSADRLKAGVIKKAQYAESVAAAKKAEWEELQAVLGYRLARVELDRIVGRISY